MKRWLAIMATAMVAVGLTVGSGCRSTSTIIPKAGLPALRVGVSPDYPPVIYRQGTKIVGLEAELAQELARSLGRPLQFVEVAWDDQIAALIAGKTDIIMSGMTVTDARQVRIDFTDPFLTLGQMALVRSKEASKYPTAKSVIESDAEIGVQKGSTAEVFARRTFRSAARVTCLEPKNAPYYLQTGRIDVFLNDGPAIIWMASENEADLAAVPEPLTRESLAWGVRKGDRPLLEAANAALAQWKTSGALDRLVRHWLPAHKPAASGASASQER